MPMSGANILLLYDLPACLFSHYWRYETRHCREQVIRGDASKHIMETGCVSPRAQITAPPPLPLVIAQGP